ncbi:unnamed protein product, partial [Rangifer tarandus platyrhynchus]
INLQTKKRGLMVTEQCNAVSQNNGNAQIKLTEGERGKQGADIFISHCVESAVTNYSKCGGLKQHKLAYSSVDQKCSTDLTGDPIRPEALQPYQLQLVADLGFSEHIRLRETVCRDGPAEGLGTAGQRGPGAPVMTDAPVEPTPPPGSIHPLEGV